MNLWEIKSILMSTENIVISVPFLYFASTFLINSNQYFLNFLLKFDNNISFSTSLGWFAVLKTYKSKYGPKIGYFFNFYA